MVAVSSGQADPAGNRVVVIHAGFHKTGTTSVQAALAAHREALAPVFALQLPRGPAFRTLTRAARLWSAERRPMAMRLYRQALAQWLGGLDLAAGQGLIVSSEDLAGHMPGDFGITDYGAAPRLLAELARGLRAAFPGADLRVVLGTRAPGAWLASLHWQQAKRHTMLEDAAAFADRMAGAVRTGPVLEAVARATGAPVHAAPLEEQAQRRLGPVEAIYDAAGLGADLRAHLAPVPAANRGAPAQLVAAFVALNRQTMPREDRQAAKDALLAQFRAGLPL